MAEPSTGSSQKREPSECGLPCQELFVATGQSLAMGLSQSEFCKVICETLTLRTDDPDRGAMARDIQDTGKERSEVRNFSRREVLGLIGATAAVSLVAGPGEESASAQTQNTKGRIVRIDAKPETNRD